MKRKFVLTKIAPGDYLLPSNDGKTIWRISRYEDTADGPVAISDWPRDKEVWGLWRWHWPTKVGSAVDTSDWDSWDFFDGQFSKRADAIDSALKVPAPTPPRPSGDTRPAGQILADAFAKT